MRHLLSLKRSGVAPVFNKVDNLKKLFNVPLYISDEEDEEGEIDGGSQQSSPTLVHKPIERTSSAAEWIGITTNSEECSYSSADNSGSQLEYSENNGGEWNDYVTPTVILNSNCAISDRSRCQIRKILLNNLAHCGFSLTFFQFQSIVLFGMDVN